MAHPEVIVTQVEPGHPLAGVGRVQAWAVGPGLGTDDVAQADVRALLADRPATRRSTPTG